MDGLDGAAGYDGVSPARARLSADPDHLPARLWGLLGALTLAWGFNWTAMKLALSQVPPWTFRSTCLVLGSGILFFVLRLGGHKLSPPRGQWRRLVLLSVLNIGAWNILVAYGLTMIASGRAAILGYTMPVLAIPLSIWLLGERLTPAKITGLALGMAGLGLLLVDAFGAAQAAPLGTLLVLGAAASWALGAVLQKKYPVGMAPGPYTAWIMLVSGVPILAGAILLEDVSALARLEPAALFGIAYNVLVAFAFAHWAWIKLATSLSVTVFSLSMLLIPVVGVLSGMVFLGERPSASETIAMLLILAALVTVVAPRRG